MNPTCPECGEKIIGRSDKKFCSDACRNAHNNALILEALNTQDKTKVTKNTLLKHGFIFDYFTGTYTTKSGSTYYYVYDQGYLPLDNDFYLLVKNEIS